MDLTLLERAAQRDFWADDTATLDAVLKLYERGLIELDILENKHGDVAERAEPRVRVKRLTAKGCAYLDSAFSPS